MKKILFLSVFILSIFCLVFAVDINLSSADTAKDLFNKNLEKTGNGIGYTKTLQDKDLSSLVGEVLSYVLAFLGVIFLGFTIYGGYVWMTARGNEQGLEKAKNTLRNVIIGLAIILVAYALTFWISQYLGPQAIGGYSE